MAGLGALLLPALCGGAMAAELIDVRFGVTNQNATRIVFDIRGSFDHVVSGDGQGQGRLYVDLAGMSVSGALGRAPGQSANGAGHIANYRVANYRVNGAKQGAKVELRLSRTAKIAKIFVLEPKGANKNHRLVVDLQSANKKQFLASLPAPAFDNIEDVIKAATASPPPQSPPPQQSSPSQKSPAPKPAKADEPPKAAKNAWPIIVIDAGHGGADPGATGQNGTKESAVTLASALKLAEILKKTGRYRVVLTRASDVRLAHDERIEIARNAGADLFISLHADSHGDPDLRGGSVYTLSDEGTERSAREAREQGNYTVYGEDIADHEPVVGDLLLSLAQRETSNESSQFASILIKNLKGETPLLNNTHRKGNFKLLLSPDVPAVLLELAFISNTKDEANLVSKAWRSKTMRAAAAAIDLYFERLSPSRHAANNAGAGR